MNDHDRDIDTAERRYRAGDYRTARRLAKRIEQSAANEDAKTRATRILRATGVDPFAIAAFAITGGLLLFLIIRYIF